MFWRSKLNQHLQALAQRYGWRYFPELREARGMHRGVGCSVLEADSQLHFTFFGPGANLSNEILNEFTGFTHFAAAGLPTSWLKGRTFDDFSCTVRLDRGQVDALGEERFFDLPEIVARDLHAHGALENVPCTQCGEANATELAQVQYSLTYLCLNCWLGMARRAADGALPSDQRLPWGAFLVRLAFVFVLGIAGWSGFLQWAYAHSGSVRWLWGWLLLFGFGLAATPLAVPRFAAATWAARGLILATVAIAVQLGSLWAYRAALLADHPDADLMAVLTHYVLFLRHADVSDVGFAVMAVIGSLVGMLFFRRRRDVAFR